MTIPAEKIAKIRQLVEQMLLGPQMVDKVGLRSFAGLMAWVANLCPQLSPFTRMLWAALSTRAEHDQIFLKQIQMPFSWILAFTKALNGP